MRIVVIGAGVGGMAAALRLAKAGHEVTVVEANERVGGKLNVWEPDVPGVGRFRFDTGPHVLTMPWAIEALFRDLGHDLRDHLDLVRVDPICRYHFADGAPFDAPADPDEAARRVAERFPGDEDGFRDLLAYARRVYDATSSRSCARISARRCAASRPRRSGRSSGGSSASPRGKRCTGASSRHLRAPRLRQIFDLYALYNGSSPFKASAIFAIIAWVQWGQGNVLPARRSADLRGRPDAARRGSGYRTSVWARGRRGSGSKGRRPGGRRGASRTSRSPGRAACPPTPWSATPTRSAPTAI
jgi:phytoene dehydrogenase-like protein